MARPLNAAVSFFSSPETNAKEEGCVPFFKKNIFYLFIPERHRARARERQRHRQREKEAPRREPDVGLDPSLQDHTPGCRRRQTAVPPGLPSVDLYYLAQASHVAVAREVHFSHEYISFLYSCAQGSIARG